MTNFTSEKCKQIALARLDVVHKWLEYRKKSQNKLQADYDFVKLHNTSNSHLYEILGNISRGSLQQEHTPKQKPTGCLTPEFVQMIEREILGINPFSVNNGI